MNLPLHLKENSFKLAEHPALSYKEESFTYSQLNALIDQFASSLLDLGVMPGDRILTALNNCPEFIITWYAAMRVKAVFVPVNLQDTKNEFRNIMLDCTPTLVITTEGRASVLAEVLAEIPDNLGLIVTSPTEKNSPYLSFPALIERNTKYFKLREDYGRNDIAEIIYTSGTHSSQKGVMLTHYNLYSNARSFVQLYQFTSQDRFLMISPLFQAASQTCLLNAAILAGATLIIKDGWVNPQSILTLIQNYQITYTFGPPTLYNLLISHPEALNYNLTSWKIAVSSGTALSAETFFRFREKFGFDLCEVYGLTETSPLVCCNSPQALKKPGSIGLPLPGTEVKVVDYEENEMEGSNVGEIIVRGSNIMKGYYRKEEATDLALRGQWLHTGDFGYKDSDGYFYIMDKKKDVIIRGGFPVYPREVEEVLYQHPFVLEAAVAGVPDPLMGEEVLAFILLREDKKIAPEELQSFCRDKIAMYKIPKYVKIVDNIPKNLSGKLLRGALQEMIPTELED